MKLFLCGPNAFGNVHNNPDLRLSDWLLARGWEFTSRPESAQAVCVVEFPDSRTLRLIAKAGKARKTLVLIQEPEVVRPNNKLATIRSSGFRLIEVGRPNPLVRWPNVWPDNLEDNFRIPKERLAVMVASNKISLIKGELYSLRRKTISENPDLVLAGFGWDNSSGDFALKAMKELAITARWKRFPKITGLSSPVAGRKLVRPVANKINFVSQFKVSVVIENSLEYQSEKLLDALLAGTIPVYVGPDPRVFGIPNGLVNWLGESRDIRSAIDKALSQDFKTWSSLARSWLIENVDTKEMWSYDCLWHRIDRELRELADSD